MKESTMYKVFATTVLLLSFIHTIFYFDVLKSSFLILIAGQVMIMSEVKVVKEMVQNETKL